jgi:hypothetical protein
MRIGNFLFIALIIFPLSISKAETHKITPLINFHLDQHDAPGFGLIYHYQYIEGFELEGSFISSNDLELMADSTLVQGDYEQFSGGLLFSKAYSPELELNFSFGASYISNSSNETLIEKSSIAPYLKISADYQLSTNSAISFGQISQFNQNTLGTNHSLFVGFSFSFGKRDPKTTIRQRSSQPTEKITANKNISLNKSISSPTQSKSSVLHPIDVAKEFWYVQFGAYKNEHNAKLFSQQLNHQLSQTLYKAALQVITKDDLFIVVSTGFLTKERALLAKSDFDSAIVNNSFINKIVIN